MCVSGSSFNTKNTPTYNTQNEPETLSSDMKQQANFDLNLAKKLQSLQLTKSKSEQQQEANYLIFFLPDLIRVACIASSDACDTLKLAGLDLLNDLILQFAHVEEPNPEFKGHLILEQYQAQVSAALRPQFSIETSAHVTAKACHVCSVWISSGVARDLNDLRRVHQLLVSSLQKLTRRSNSGEDSLIYSELSLTVEKLAVLRAWAEVYIVAQRNLRVETRTGVAGEDRDKGLLGLVKPELMLLSYHWSVSLKDYAYLSLPDGEVFDYFYS